MKPAPTIVGVVFEVLVQALQAAELLVHRYEPVERLLNSGLNSIRRAGSPCPNTS
jgi:hypothetical protein